MKISQHLYIAERFTPYVLFLDTTGLAEGEHQHIDQSLEGYAPGTSYQKCGYVSHTVYTECAISGLRTDCTVLLVSEPVG